MKNAVLIFSLVAMTVSAQARDRWFGRECVDKNIKIDNFSTVLVKGVPPTATYDCENGPNAKAISDPKNGEVYRGKRIESADQATSLLNLGVRTILTLESDGGLEKEIQAVKEAAAKLGGFTVRVISIDSNEPIQPAGEKEITFINVAMPSVGKPTEEMVQTALNIAKNKNLYPLYVNCKRGADRTGLVIGMLRLQNSIKDPEHQWTKEEILAEQKNFARTGSSLQGSFKALDVFLTSFEKQNLKLDLK